MNIMLFTTARSLTEAIKIVEEKCEEQVLFTRGSGAENFLRFIYYHLHEYDMVIIDKEVDSFEIILDYVIDCNFGEKLGVKMIILSSNVSGEEMESELRLGSDAKYVKVDYTSTSWLYELLKN